MGRATVELRDLCDTSEARGSFGTAVAAPFQGSTPGSSATRTDTDALTAVRSQAMKGSQKPKKTGKKPAQKSLKERRTEKRAAAKQTRSLDV